MGFFPSLAGWNISPAHAAGLSPAPFCSELEHQPTPRGWANTDPSQSILFLFIISLFFVCFFYHISIFF